MASNIPIRGECECCANHIPEKSRKIHMAGIRESGLILYMVHTILTNKLQYRTQKPHSDQQLNDTPTWSKTFYGLIRLSSMWAVFELTKLPLLGWKWSRYDTWANAAETHWQYGVEWLLHNLLVQPCYHNF